MKLHRYVDHQRLHIVTKDVISLSISVLLLFRHYISHKITFGAPSSGGVLCSACGAFILFAPTFPYFFMKMPYYPYFFTLKCHSRVEIQKVFLARFARLDFMNEQLCLFKGHIVKHLKI